MPRAAAGIIVRGQVATDTIVITRAGTAAICDNLRPGPRHAERPRGRPPSVTLVDKANVLTSYAFFRALFDEVAADYPDVQTDHAYVDAMTAFLVQRPHRYDVLVAENMFGDIISDLAAATVGGLGMRAAGDIGDQHAPVPALARHRARHRRQGHRQPLAPSSRRG